MPDLVVIVPTRGRPEAAVELRAVFEATTTADTQLCFVIDKRDVDGIYDYPFEHNAATVWQESTTMVEALNLCALDLIDPRQPLGGVLGNPFAVGFMGDDHRPRTRGWDERYLEKLRELGTGMVFGDDLIQHGNLPTQIAMTSDIVRALGWMAPPDLIHMYVDNWWLQLGMRTGCIRYLPDVVVEHVHPVTGKVEWDEGHTRVNHPSMYQRDAATFARLQALELPRAVGKVRAMRTPQGAR